MATDWDIQAVKSARDKADAAMKQLMEGKISAKDARDAYETYKQAAEKIFSRLPGKPL